MERLQGTLLDLMVEMSDLSAQKRTAVVRKVASQVLGLLALMHSEGVVHSDLKPENVLIRSYCSHSGDTASFLEPQVKVKVVDFANCFSVNDMKHRNPGNPNWIFQTLTYRAPEVFLGRGPLTCSLDLWSLGCILAELSLLRPLFSGQTEKAVWLEIEGLLKVLPSQPVKNTIPDHPIVRRSPAFFMLYDKLASVDIQLADFVDKLLRMDPKARLCPLACFQHRYLQRVFPFQRVLFRATEGSSLPYHHKQSFAIPEQNRKPAAPAAAQRTSQGLHQSKLDSTGTASLKSLSAEAFSFGKQPSSVLGGNKSLVDDRPGMREPLLVPEGSDGADQSFVKKERTGKRGQILEESPEPSTEVVEMTMTEPPPPPPTTTARKPGQESSSSSRKRGHSTQHTVQPQRVVVREKRQRRRNQTKEWWKAN